MTIQVCDPTAEPSVAVEPYMLAYQPFPGTVIGMCSNGFTDAVVFLRDIEDEIAPMLPGVRFSHFAKPTLRHSSFPWTVEEIKTVTSECDAVIAAYGHCGSCTSAVIRDAANIARSGVPVISIVTTKFVDEARFVARATGIPDLPMVIVPHPVAGRDQDYQRGIAGQIAGPILEAFAISGVPA
jgi:hypothetical protein